MLPAALSLLLIGCGGKSFTSSHTESSFPGINIEASDTDSDIIYLDDRDQKEAVINVKSSFFMMNPHQQAWMSYYLFESTLAEFPDVAPETEQEIPIVYNARVMHYVNHYQNRGRRSFSIWLERSGKYVPNMKTILQQKGMPTDLVYLSMIESGFQVKARSHKAAVGPWQFIKPTAKRYGLRVDAWVDERMDPEKSTIAAANYLSDLYAMFQNWELAAAGYNCGEDRVQSAIDKYGINDFWQISEFTLPKETKNYVPKLMAALIVAKNPEKYGFVGIQYQPSQDYVVAYVPGQKSLKDIAGVIGVSQSTLVELNPALKLKATPPGATYDINVPPGYGIIVAQKSTELTALSNVNTQIAKYGGGGTKRHKVRRGDTLGKISYKYGVSVSKIKRANGLRSSTIRVGQSLKIPGVSGGSYTPSHHNTSTAKYKVRSGDTLGAISARHRVSISSVKKANGLRGSLIRTGQVLTIPGSSGRYYETERGSGSTTKTATYKVRSGDTLGVIASRHNVSVSTIKRANGIKGSMIRPGQVLTIPYLSNGSRAASTNNNAKTNTTNYKVRSGDTLGTIAERHGVKLATLRSTNNIHGSTIRPGQVLTIPGSSNSSYKGASSNSVNHSNPGTYKVKPGDTLGIIAQRHGVKLASLRSANNLNGSTIRSGQVLTIPNGNYSTNSSAKKSAPSKYTVKSGDTLGSIAQRHGVRLASLKSANNIKGSNIRSGQVLTIPSGNYSSNTSSGISESNIISYKVKNGDSLWEIASKHNVSVASIKKWNNLKSNNLQPGKKLTIYK
jgi:peptidoglycan lytic transglycosylase D